MLYHNLVLFLKSGELPQLGLWTYIFLAILVAIEGPIATLLGAAAASAGLMRPWLVFIAAAIGNITSDSLWYSLGYMGRTEWLFHIGRRIGLSESLIQHLERNMNRHASKFLFLAKLTVSFVIPSLIAAGLMRVPWRKWFPPLIVAETLWTGSLVLIGYYTTEAIKRVEQGVEYAVLAASIIFVVVVIFVGRRLIKQFDKDNDEPASHSNE